MLSSTTRLGGVLALLLLLALVSCGSSEESEPDSDEPQALMIDIQPSSFWVRRGDTMTVQVHVSGDRGSRESIIVRAKGLPNGVSAGDLILQPGDQSDAALTFMATSDATTGGPHLVEIEAFRADEVAVGTAELTVAGHPGDRDPGFGDLGSVIVPIEVAGPTQFVAGDSGVYLLVWNGLDSEFSLMRISKDGRVDRIFGKDGTVRFPADSAIGCALTHSLPLGVVVVCAGGSRDNGTDESDLVIHCLDEHGRFNEICGEREFVIPGKEGNGLGQLSLAVDAKGRLIIASHVGDKLTGDTVLRVIRLAHVDRLSVDSDFGQDGKTELTGTRRLSQAIALDDGGILLVGARGTQSQGFAIRLQEDGAPSSTFGENGYLALEQDILAAAATGEATFLKVDRATIMGIDARGQKVATFGAEGLLDLGDGVIRSLAKGKHSGIHARKSVSRHSEGVFGYIQKFSAAGEVDPHFTSRILDGGSEFQKRPVSWLGFSPDGRLLVGFGEADGEPNPSIAVARFWP